MASLISKAQIAKIWAMAREIDLSKETVYDVVYKVTGSDSISSLSSKEGIEVIEEFNQISKELKELGIYPERKHRPGMASDKQLKYIEDLAFKLGWEEDPKRLRGYLKKYYKVEHIKWLTLEDASKAIEGLKAIYKRSLATHSQKNLQKPKKMRR